MLGSMPKMQIKGAGWLGPDPLENSIIFFFLETVP